jgi:hypothetical protein
MRRNILTASFILLTMAGGPFFLSAQQTPHFLTTLYFEDAAGNQDSIEFGYDYTATEGMDAAFGEYELTDPFDPVFEVRAASRDFVFQPTPAY